MGGMQQAEWSALAPMKFQVYINYMTNGLGSCISLFADDAKIIKKVTDEKDLGRIHEWSQKWEIQFNANKCKVLEFGKKHEESKLLLHVWQQNHQSKIRGRLRSGNTKLFLP